MTDDSGASSRSTEWLNRQFGLKLRQTTVRQEALAGLTSFLAAAYLVVVIPALLSTGGMDRAAVTTVTLAMMAIFSLAMGLYANFPFVVGPGLGGSVILGVTLTQVEHIPWPTGLGIAALSGLLFFVLTITGARALVVRWVPRQIKQGLGASIGLFIAVLGCRQAGFVAVNAKTNALLLADFSHPGALVALTGLLVILALEARRVLGSLLMGILIATVVGLPLGVSHLPHALVSLPRSAGPILFNVDFAGAFTPEALPYLFAFFAGEFFSTLGTTLAIGAKAGLTDEHGNLPQIERAFAVDSVAATVGPLVGIPALTALVESAAGAETGGRTGLTAIFAAICFAVTLFLTPLALVIPKEATAPALIIIGVSMLQTIRGARSDTVVDTLADTFPTLVMVLLTVISNSFGIGIAGGVVFYVLVKIFESGFKELSPGLVLLAIPLAYYLYGAATTAH
jgi:AGZA family xanthine/uracil permease-like MFS transporter